MAQFGRIVLWLGNKLNWVTFVALILMMVLTCSDVIGRYVFNQPILGVYDVTGLVGIVIIAGALARTQILRGHVSMSYFISRLRRRQRAVAESVIWLISFGLFVVITWQSFVYATSMRHMGEGTTTVGIPISPFVYVLVVGCGLMCLVLLVDFIKSVTEAVRK